MSQSIADSVAERRFIVLLTALTGSLALLLAAAGIYGVISYTTSLRTSEIGLRMALGAAPRNVQAQVFRGGLLLAVTGMVIGIAAALAITRALDNVLVGLFGHPLPVISAVALLLIISTLAR
jgi:ABC-type antimicrobial peptide transport system permease subunit